MTEREMARKKAARKARARKARNRRVALTICLMLVVCVVSVGGTLAWLTDNTENVTNTFTPSDISIKLEEDNPELVQGKHVAKMVPGKVIDKDPKVTVLAGSEPCWVFVTIDESNNFDKFFESYSLASPWQPVTDEDGVVVDGVYYIKQDADEGSTVIAADKVYPVLEGNKVVVKSTITKADMRELHPDDPSTSAVANFPTLTFQAYAIQQLKFDTVEAAWAEVSN